MSLEYGDMRQVTYKNNMWKILSKQGKIAADSTTVLSYKVKIFKKVKIEKISSV